jgi:hypothetical protein
VDTTFTGLERILSRDGYFSLDIIVYYCTECATRLLVPTYCPVLFLTRVAAVPRAFALRADFEVLKMAQNLAPGVEAISRSLQRDST